MSRALAKHILEVVPESAKVIFENDAIRVIVTTMRKGQKIPIHSHRKGFAYTLNSGQIRLTPEGGKPRVGKVSKGEASWSDQGETHAVENLGGTLRELYVEFKG